MDVQGIRQLDASAAKARLEDGAALLDVREVHEWRQARIPGSLFIPMSQLQERVDEVPTDRPLVVVCHSGMRSQQVAAWLSTQGRDAANLMHGIVGWARMGQPIDTDPVD